MYVYIYMNVYVYVVLKCLHVSEWTLQRTTARATGRGTPRALPLPGTSPAALVDTCVIVRSHSVCMVTV